MSAFRLLGKDLVLYGIMGGLSRSVQLLLLPILTRQFSPDEYGMIDIIATMTTLLAISMSLTLESAVARLWFECSESGKEKQLVSSVIAFIVIFGTIIFTVIYFQAANIAELILDDSRFSNYIVLGALASLLMALSGIPQIILRMERKIMHYNVLILMLTVSNVVIALLLIFVFDVGLLSVFLANAIASGLALGLGFLLVAKHIGLCFSPSLLLPSLRYSLPLVPAVAITWLNGQVDKIILLILLGLSAVGIFGVAAKIGLIIALLVNVFQQAWSPLAIAQIEGDEASRNEFYRRALNYYAGIMASLALVLIAFSKEVLALLAPSEYQEAYILIPWIVGALILQGSGNITNLGILISKRTIGTSIAAGFGVLANIGIGLLLIPRFGVWGAAVGAFIAGLIYTSLLSYFTLRVTDVRFDLSKVLGVLLYYVFACVAFFAVDEYVSSQILSLIVRMSVLTLAIWCVVSLSLDDAARNIVRSSVRSVKARISML